MKPKSAASEGTKHKHGRSGQEHPADHGRATRETIESIAIAIILAFLFRAFVAEAFVIPTGSMAPTLQGRHMDVVCAQCGHPYRTGASVENEAVSEVIGTTCPICRFRMQLDKVNEPNQRSFNGDRILVSKFEYELGDPERWDVIVFKYPGNAKQNYIKRLVGLPNERLMIRHGDIYTQPLRPAAGQAAAWQIARKPPHKILALAQLVDDTKYRPLDLQEAGWPERWQDWQSPDQPSWQQMIDGDFKTTGRGDGIAWLRYRHLVPRDEDWSELLAGNTIGRLQNDPVEPALIADYYAYNDGIERYDRRFAPGSFKALGMHWVGDLSVLADVDVISDRGGLLLDLVEGGQHYQCRIDVATGDATLSIDGGARSFASADQRAVQHPVASTAVRGPGSYRLRLANCDDQLVLWVNDRVVEFDGPTTYHPDENVVPQWSPDDPGDAEPAGIGADGAELRVSRLRLYRDVYYVATDTRVGYDLHHMGYDYDELLDPQDIRQVLDSPALWSNTVLFSTRRAIEFELAADQFFPLGDNSPASRDGRLWSDDTIRPPPYVPRELLTGKALLIYWPHSWRRPVPFFPNFERMGLIR